MQRLLKANLKQSSRTKIITILNTEQVREQALTDLKQAMQEVNQKMGSNFVIRLPGLAELRRIPEFKEKSSEAAYYQHPASDGSRPGIFWVNLRDMKECSKVFLKTLMYHEAIPGHHYQHSV